MGALARWAVAAVTIVMAATVAVLTGPAAAQDARSEGGMIAWPRDDMVRALEILIPERMAELDVPGLALAIVADGEIVWEAGFGSSAAPDDASGEAPVTAYTLFEAASLGKPVAAYGAMMLVRDGTLALDAPLSHSLDAPWLPDARDHEAITLRHVLTHSSGLSNFIRCCGRGTWSEPGAEFGYSGVGYMYLQHVLETTTGEPFERLMKPLVFAPLGMESSGYALAPPLLDTIARGHVPAYYPILAFFVPFSLLLGLFVIVTVLVVWIGLDRSRLRPGDFAVPLGLALLVTPVPIYLLLGGAAAALSVGVALFYAVAVAGGSGLIVALFGFLGLMGPEEGVLARGRPARRALMTAIAAGLAIALSIPFIQFNLAVPASPPDNVNAASSLRSTAHDLGRFVGAFVDATALGTEMRDRMAREQVAVGGGISWGLGIGVRRSAAGETLWQWGSNPGFESLMVIDPGRRAGVVVLTNAVYGAPLVQEIAGHVLGEEPGWALP